MTRLSNDELQRVHAWLDTKQIDKCSVCNEQHPFGDIPDLGAASESWGEREPGYLPEKAGHVDLLVIPTYAITGTVGRNSTYPSRSTPEQALRRVFTALRAIGGAVRRQKVLRITCQNCGHVELFDARVIGVEGEER